LLVQVGRKVEPEPRDDSPCLSAECAGEPMIIGPDDYALCLISEKPIRWVMNRGLFAFAVPWGQEEHEAFAIADRYAVKPPSAFLKVRRFPNVIRTCRFQKSPEPLRNQLVFG
jgi:hypothetical protein